MFKLRHSRKGFLLLALAMLCTLGVARAQEAAAGPEVVPVALDQNQAAHRVVTRTQPEYPPIARVNYLQGKVRLQLTVDGAGKVVDAHVLEGNAVLAAAAVEAVRHWIYRPLSTTSGPAGFTTSVRVKYYLTSASAELSPRQAEKDFLRQVKPAQAIPPQPTEPSGDLVHLRLLVNDQGQVDDLQTSPIGRRQFVALHEMLRRFSFRPARWGNLPIASYLEIDVPLGTQSFVRATTAVASQ